MPQPSSNARRAREQASAYDSVFAPTPLTLKYEDGSTETITIPPHPNLRMLDDDRMEAYERLLFEVESYDRDPDVYIPETTLESGVILPAETRRGKPLEPYRVDGELVTPPHSVKIVQVALGEETYAKLRRAGMNAADIWRIWNEQGMTLAERAEQDAKSNGRTRGMGVVPR